MNKLTVIRDVMAYWRDWKTFNVNMEFYKLQVLSGEIWVHRFSSKSILSIIKRILIVRIVVTCN
jgi:hypothetical protein